MRELKETMDRVRADIEAQIDLDQEWARFNELAQTRNSNIEWTGVVDEATDGSAELTSTNLADPVVPFAPPKRPRTHRAAPSRTGPNRPGWHRPAWAQDRTALLWLAAAAVVAVFVGSVIVFGSPSRDQNDEIVIEGTTPPTTLDPAPTVPPSVSVDAPPNSQQLATPSLAAATDDSTVNSTTSSLASTGGAANSTVTTTTSAANAPAAGTNTTTTAPTTTTTSVAVADQGELPGKLPTQRPPDQQPPSEAPGPIVTTTTTPQPPAGPIGLPSRDPGAVSYLDPPPNANIVELGAITWPSTAGRPIAAIGDLGVAVQTTYPDGAGRIVVLGIDETVREIPVDGKVRLVAYGPGDVAYVELDGQLGAMPLSGPNVAKFIPAQPGVGDGQLSNGRDAVFGHLPSGIFNRNTYPQTGVVAMGYVDVEGKPIRLDDEEMNYFRIVESGTDFARITDSFGDEWSLSIERSPEWKNWWPIGTTGASVPYDPASLGRWGSGVFWTQIGPWSSSDPIDGLPSQWVVANLSPFGGVEWRSVPNGWQIVASDVWGTVVYRPTAGGGEFAMLEILPPLAAHPPITTPDGEIDPDEIPPPDDFPYPGEFPEPDGMPAPAP